MKKKSLILSAASLALVAAVSVAGTLAYFTDTTETKQNVFTAGAVDISINDTTVGPQEGDTWTATSNSDGSGIEYNTVMPGDVLSKVVSVTVEDESQPAWVAIKLDVAATPATDSALTEEDAIDAIKDIIAEQVDIAKWVLADGIYYYQTAVEAGDTTESLFSELQIPTDWGNDYANIQFRITVSAAAVQQANIATAADAQPELAALFAAQQTPDNGSSDSAPESAPEAAPVQ